MKRSFTIAKMLIIAVVISGCSKNIPDNVTELVYATPYSPSHPFSRADQKWMKFVEERSGGSLKIVPNWSGALLSSEHSMIEIRHGVADIGLITPIYVRGGTHLIRQQSGFYSGITTIANQLSLYRCLEQSNSQFEKELSGLKVLAIQGGGLPGVITTHKRIESLADLKGLRLRAPTELLAVLEQLGVDPVNLPMSEVYSALAKGIIDGVVAPVDTFKSLHFAEVASHYTELKIPRGAYPARAMNIERWQQLSKNHHLLLEKSIAVWEAALAEQIEQSLKDGRKLALEEGVEITDVSAADQNNFDQLYLQFAARNAESLSRFNIDGQSVFSTARASVGADGSVTCARGGH